MSSSWPRGGGVGWGSAEQVSLIIQEVYPGFFGWWLGSNQQQARECKNSMGRHWSSLCFCHWPKRPHGQTKNQCGRGSPKGMCSGRHDSLGLPVFQQSTTVFIKTPRGRPYKYPHFSDEETEANTCWIAHTQQEAKPRSGPSPSPQTEEEPGSESRGWEGTEGDRPGTLCRSV